MLKMVGFDPLAKNGKKK